MERHLEASEGRLQEHFKARQSAFEEFEAVLNEGLSSLLKQVLQTGDLVADNIAAAPQGTAEPPQQDPQGNTDRMLTSWTRIRDHLEAIADSPRIDGRTRAKYARIDRRTRGQLVAALDVDRNLDADPALYREAIELWNRFKTRRATPSATT